MSDWLFNPAYRAQVDLPPTQQREVVKRLAKKNILDVTAASDEIQTVLRAVWTAYGNKKGAGPCRVREISRNEERRCFVFHGR